MYEIEVRYADGNVVSIFSDTREGALAQLRRVWTPQVKVARVWQGDREVYCYQR